MERGVRYLCAVFAATFCLLTSAPARAQPIYPGTNEHALPQRYALVIGIGRYKTSGVGFFPDLKNAEADAKLIVSELQETGVKPVNIFSVISDDRSPLVTRNRIAQAVADLRKSLETLPEINGRRRAVVFVYFAGHGLGRAKDGENYLIPADFHVDTAEDIPDSGIALSALLKRIASTKPLDIFTIIDACRDIPFKDLRTLDDKIESFEAGLVNVSDNKTSLATIGRVTILFSTLKYMKAPDGTGGHSPFATAFATHLKAARDPKVSLRPRHIDDLSKSIQATLARRSPVQTPELQPASPYKLWLYPIRQDFEVEKQTYDDLRQSFRLDVDKIRTDPRTICVGRLPDEMENTRTALERFIAQYGSSYYGDDGLILAAALDSPLCLLVPTGFTTMQSPWQFGTIQNPSDRSALAVWAKTFENVPLAQAYVINTQALLQAQPAQTGSKAKAKLTSGNVVALDPKAAWYDEWIKVVLPTNSATRNTGFIRAEEATKAIVPFKTNIDFKTAGNTTISAEELARLKDLLSRLGTSVLVKIKATHASSDQVTGLTRALAASRTINNMTKEFSSGEIVIVPEIADASFVPPNQVQLDLDIAPIATNILQAMSKHRLWKHASSAETFGSVPLESMVAIPYMAGTPSLYPIAGLMRDSQK